MRCPKCKSKCNVYNDLESGMILATEDTMVSIFIDCPTCKDRYRFGFNAGELYKKKNELGDKEFKKFIKCIEKQCIKAYIKRRSKNE